MNFLTKALTAATHDSAKVMTTEVRHHAIQQGWEPEVASGISIKYDGEKLNYDLGSDHRDRAFVHEFGNENQPPKATIRRYLSDLSGVKDVFPAIYENRLRGK